MANSAEANFACLKSAVAVLSSPEVQPMPVAYIDVESICHPEIDF